MRGLQKTRKLLVPESDKAQAKDTGSQPSCPASTLQTWRDKGEKNENGGETRRASLGAGLRNAIVADSPLGKVASRAARHRHFLSKWNISPPYDCFKTPIFCILLYFW